MVAYVVRRDNGVCHICGGEGADSADHIIPRSAGGSSRADNLRAVHHNVEPLCNRVRGDRSVDWTRDRLARKAAESTDEGASWQW